MQKAEDEFEDEEEEEEEEEREQLDEPEHESGPSLLTSISADESWCLNYCIALISCGS